MPKVQRKLREVNRTQICSTINDVSSTSWSSRLRSSTKKVSKQSPSRPYHSNCQRHLAGFFAGYITFHYNPAKSATDEFRRLCKSNRWNGDRSKEIKARAKGRFQDALTKQFNDNYGTDVNKLTNWQALCAKLRMDPVPENLESCREAMASTHVNLVDLVDKFSPQKRVQIFPTVLALSEYTRSTGKIFPRRNLHAGSLLKFLLRHIFEPQLDRYRGHRGRGRA